MSVTYTDTPHDTLAEEAYVPVYARKRAARGRTGARGLKTWMILAPLGLVVVGGVTAAMLLNGGEAEVAPAEVAALAPAVAQAPLADLMAAPATEGAALGALRPVEPAAPAVSPVEAAPAVAVPVRPAPRVQNEGAAIAPPAAPTAAVPDPGGAATADLNRAQVSRTAPAATAAPTATAPRAPAIEVQPFPGQ